jgi:hypothetical protein
MEHKTTTVTRSDGSEKITKQVRLTPKGLTKLAKIVPPNAKIAGVRQPDYRLKILSGCVTPRGGGVWVSQQNAALCTNGRNDGLHCSKLKR